MPTYHTWLNTCAQNNPLVWLNPMVCFFRKLSMITPAWTTDISTGFIDFNDNYKSNISITGGHFDIGSQEARDAARHVLSFLMPSPFLAYALVQFDHDGQCQGGFDVRVFPTRFAIEHLNCITNLQPFTMEEGGIVFDGHTLSCYGKVIAMADYPAAGSDCEQAKLTIIPDHRYPPSMELAYAFGLYESDIISNVPVVTHLPLERPDVSQSQAQPQPDVFNVGELFV